MPPTTSEIAAMPTSSSVSVCVVACAVCDQLVGAAHGEVVGAAGQNLVALFQQRGDGRLRRIHVIGAIHLGHDLIDVGHIVEAGKSRVERHENGIILVAQPLCALGLQHANHAERLPLDQDRLP